MSKLKARTRGSWILTFDELSHHRINGSVRGATFGFSSQNHKDWRITMLENILPKVQSGMLGVQNGCFFSSYFGWLAAIIASCSSKLKTRQNSVHFPTSSPASEDKNDTKHIFDRCEHLGLKSLKVTGSTAILDFHTEVGLLWFGVMVGWKQIEESCGTRIPFTFVLLSFNSHLTEWHIWRFLRFV